MGFAQLIKIALPLSVALTVFAFGLVVRREDAWYLRRRPSLLGRSLLAFYVIAPAIALGLAAAFDLEPALKVALIALSLSPVSPLAPWKQVKAGGHEDYLSALLWGTALLSVVLIPLDLSLIGRALDREVAVQPRPVLNIVLITVLVPIICAAVIRGLVGQPTAARISRPLIRVAIVLVLLFFLPIVAVTFRDALALIGNGTLLAIAIQVTAALVAGHLLGGPDRADRIALALSTASRHPAVAIAVGQAVAPGDRQVIAAVLLYLVVSSAACAFYLKWLAHHHRAPPQPVPA